METIIIYPKNKAQAKTLKTILKEMKIRFEKAEAQKSPYNPEFIAKIKQGDIDKKAGRYTTYTLEQLDEICR